jgi:flagellar basal-body rod modification protein FlgD
MVNGISNASNQLGQLTQSATGGKGIMGKDDFMKLMIKQLKYQDPLNPMDGTKFASQLAEFSSLEQLTNMKESLNQSVNANLQLTQAVNNTMTAALIGKDAKLDNMSVDFNGQDSVEIGYELPSDVKDISVDIYDEAGNLVRTIEKLPKSSGEHKLSWNFTDNNGEKLNHGNYSFEVNAVDYNGENIETKSYRIGKIEAVRFTENGTQLIINGNEYKLSDVFEILESSNSVTTNYWGDKKDV